MNESALKLFNKMNGIKVRLQGNHDKHSNKTAIPTRRIILYHGGIYINLIHNPEHTIIIDERHYYPLTIHGHVHGRYQSKEIKDKNENIALCINVSLETHNYYPYSFDEIMGIYHRWVSNHPRKKDIYNWIQLSNKGCING